jgi:hypothetical protein
LCEIFDYVHIIDTQLKIRELWLNGSWHWNQLYTIGTQTTFLSGRSILDGVVPINEMIDEAKREKK